ncbi:MAG TPA: sulfate ABC transporter permease subunit CysW, partial [Caulobacteraceae bacterium]|nr:sulfate ABC transporter permease subunit CysW [Caulobacteraceae bacterium]
MFRRIHLPGAAPVMLGLALMVLGLLIVMPLGVVFEQAFSKGVSTYLAKFDEPDLWSAIRLTLLVAAISVPLNAIFGLAAAWSIAKFEFRGKSALLAIIDLPFSMSPVVSGLVWVLLFGAQGWFGAWLQDHDIRVIFTVTGIVLATITVTLPFVARELIPLMQDQGTDEEAAAVTLGARGFTIFRRITLPNVRWALLYGVLLCNARAMGEFGAVYVVSGRIAGRTDTMPLRVEKLFQEYDLAGSF